MKHFASGGGRVVSPHLSLSHERPRAHRALVQPTSAARSSAPVGFPNQRHGEGAPSVCPNHRGTLFNRETRTAIAAPCRLWACPPCGRRKARKVAHRFARLRPDFLMTLSLPHSAWATPDNLRELQRRCRWLLRYMVRHGLLEAYGWVREEGAARSECVCDPSREGCACGANGRQLHRHFLLRLPARRCNGFRPGHRRLPYAQLQAAAKRCGLGTLDFRQVHSEAGAAGYVSKYLFKSVGAAIGRARRYAMNERNAEPPAPGWVWQPGRVATVAVEFLGAVAVDWDAIRWCALDSG